MSQELDINDPSLTNEPIEVDEGSGEEFFTVPVPDDGDHYVRLELGSGGITASRQSAKKGGRPFLNVHLALSIFDPDGNKKGMVFDRVNSVMMERNGKRSSRLHAIMDLIDSPIPISTTIPEFASAVETTLAQTPAVIAVTQWQASAKAETDDDVDKAVAKGYTKAGKLDVGHYYTFLKGQKKFPPLDDGGYNPEVVNPVTDEVVRAQAIVIRYKRA